MSYVLEKRAVYARVQDANGTDVTTFPVSNAALTELEAAINNNRLDVSVSVLPLPSGAATEAKQPALGTAGTASSDVLSVQGIAGMTPLTVTTAATEASGYLWNNASVSSGDTPAGGVDCRYCPYVSIGISAGTTSSFQTRYSDDDALYFLGNEVVNFSGAGTSTVNVQPGFRYVSLECTSGTGVSATAYVSAKQ